MNIIKSRKNKNTIIKPDYVLKDIKKENRASLPFEMKVLLYLHIKDVSVPAWMFHDCMRKFPEYFEKDTKIYATGKRIIGAH